MRMTDLPDALRDEGVEPVVVDGFATRGYDFPDAPELHLVHWTAGPATGRTPSLSTVTHGRPDLPYNLCSVLQSREGGTRPDKAYCVSSGRAVHAGEGAWDGVVQGNTNGTGNEIEWSGPGEAFPGNRYETTIRIAAAHIKLQRSQAKRVCNHREYALPPGRKIDTNLDGGRIRADVLERLSGGDVTPEEHEVLERCDSLLQLLVPRSPFWAVTSGDDIGKVVSSGTAGAKQVSDLWRYGVYLELERQGQTDVLAGRIAAAVVAALPPSSGGSAPSLSDIEAAVARQLAFLKPGQ